MRTRTEKQANYRSVFINGQTLRSPLDRSRPITELQFPEFYDISFGTRCATGRCNFCYASADPKGTHYTNLVAKIDQFFGTMAPEHRPYQVAIGGSAEPLENPEAWDAMKRLWDLGILPNYTTNGVLVNKEVVAKTKALCGGVAITLHPHLEKHWRRAIPLLAHQGIKLNAHVIISDAQSIETAEALYKQYATEFDYFVLLPYMNVGLAKLRPKTIDFARLTQFLDQVYQEGRLAFGANFYNFIKTNNRKYQVSLYPPEIVSKYLALDNDLTLMNNSFECKVVKWNARTGCELGKSRTNFDLA